MITKKKFDRLFSSLNGAARKVYEAVPIQEPWSLHRIMGEISRTSTAMEQAVAIACLDKMHRSGLIRQPIRGAYIREEVRQPAPDEPEIEDDEEEEIMAGTTNVTLALKRKDDPTDDLFTGLATTASGLRDQANSLETSARAMEAQARALRTRADALDQMAIDHAGQQSELADAAGKWHNLQQMLKG